MELTCFLYPGWSPEIRPAPARRAWMDETPESFAYRCLPLGIANAHGWEVLCPCDFEATWNGQTGIEGVEVRVLSDTPASEHPVSLFGQGTVTFHVQGLFRTPPGWNLWVSGPPNAAKDGIHALTGVIETDWSPFTFTMNWRFTRPGCTVRFRKGEPIAFFFPIQRGAIEAFVPRFADIERAPELKQGFEAWSQSRDAFHRLMAEAPPPAPSDRWQKHYYRGVDVHGQAHVKDHRSKLRLRDFAERPERMPRPADAPTPAEPPAGPPARAGGGCPMHAAGGDTERAVLEARLRQAEAAVEEARQALRKREWMLETLEKHRALSPANNAIDYCESITPEEFFEQHYALNRPLVIGGAMKRWPALKRWTPEYLKRKVGGAVVEYQGGRTANARFEMEKERHRRAGPFDAFIDQISQPDAGNDTYLTAFNSARNRAALQVLAGDLGELDGFLTSGADGMLWIGPGGTFTPLHHDLTNNFIAQVVGRKRLLLAPPSEAGKLHNNRHVFSEIGDLETSGLSLERFPRLEELRLFPVELEPGDILFVPIGWWHQVRALDFSVTLTYTNFVWPNDGYRGFPEDRSTAA